MIIILVNKKKIKTNNKNFSKIRKRVDNRFLFKSINRRLIRDLLTNITCVFI